MTSEPTYGDLLIENQELVYEVSRLKEEVDQIAEEELHRQNMNRQLLQIANEDFPAEPTRPKVYPWDEPGAKGTWIKYPNGYGTRPIWGWEADYQ